MVEHPEISSSSTPAGEPAYHPASDVVAALRESERLLRETQQIARLGSWSWDIRSKVLTWSDMLCELYGIASSAAPTTFDGYLALVHPEDRPLAQVVAERCFAGGEPFQFDHRVIHPDGSVHFLHGRGRLVRDPGGQPLRMVGSSLDVTDRKAAEAALRESEQRFRRMFEVGVLGAAFFEEDGRFTEINAALLQLLGFSRGDFIAGRVNWLKLTPPEHLARDLDAFDAMRDGRVPQPYEKEYLRKDGRRVPVLVARVGLGVRASTQVHGVVFVVDLTERRRAQDAQQLLVRAGAVLAGSLDHEATLAVVGRLAVPAFADYAMVDLLEAQGGVRRLASAHADPALEGVLAEIRAFPPRLDSDNFVARVLRTGETERGVTTPELIASEVYTERQRELLRALVPHSHLCVAMTARGRIVGSLLFVRTEQRAPFAADDAALAEELGRRAGLAIDNARLYEAERRARREAEDANRAKMQFLAVMSHELRTPLNAIAGYAQLLELGVRGPTTAEQREDLTRIQRSQRHLLSLINDVLNFARLEAGRVGLRMSEVSLPPLLAELELLVHPQLAAKALRYTCADVSPAAAAALVAEADEEKVRQVLLNLLSNAIRFTPDGGAVEVSCAREDGHIHVRVRDTGIGIPANRYAQIFEPFVQLDRSLSSGHEGLGLGLAISRDLARAMGGELAVTSAVGQGTTFTLTLPAVR